VGKGAPDPTLSILLTSRAVPTAWAKSTLRLR